jgi:fumarate reductase subunit D
VNQQAEQKEARLLAAASYILFLCFLPPLLQKDNKFAMHHARQGFLLFCFEIVLAIFISIIEHSLGRIPIVGFIMVVLLNLVGWLGVLLVAVIGLVKAVSGEYWNIPVLGEYHSKVPF